MNLVVVPLFIFILNCGIVHCDLRDNEVQEDEEKSVEEKSESVGKLYENAVDAYLEENWDECIEAFNKAIHGYKMYKRMITNCRKKCKIQAAGYTPIFAEDFDDFHFYEKKIQETLCLLSCNQDYHEVAGKKALTRVPKDIENKFVENRPYEYLHNCYYQKKSYQEAANAVFTFLATNPDHEVSRNNLRYYLSLPEVKEDQVLNLEAASFLKHYVSGVAAYEDELYEMAIEHFEKSLGSYMESEEECRIYCEGPFDQGWFPEFTSSIANHFTYCLKCKRGCSAWLNTVNGEYRRDLLPSHYNYLQFSYYKIGNLKAACSAVASFLMFQPGDETMWHNKKYYESLPKVDDSYFQPREEVKAYIKRQEYELKLLRFISDEFQSLESRLNLTKTKNYKANTSSKNHSKIFSDEKLNSTSNDTAERRKVGEKLQLIKEKELGGVNRYATDGFLNKTQCEDLLQLAHIAAVQGDGYDEHKSPHSKFEKFEGLTVGRTALLVYYGLVEPKLLQLLLTTTNAARIHVEKYFKLNQPLHLTYTHLVCRSALPDSPLIRDDLSHAIHADNCLMDYYGDCSQETPAYTWRDYSAIIYLNNNFEGGEFFFANDRRGSRIQGLVLPKCGRMVGFSAGKENLHGVRGVLNGRRCALALWFTQNENYLEYERILAEAILRRIRIHDTVQLKYNIPLRYEDILNKIFEEDSILKKILIDLEY